MKQNASLFVIVLSVLFFSLNGYSAGPAKEKTTIKPLSGPVPAQSKAIHKKSVPLNISLDKKGSDLFIKLDRIPLKVELFTYKTRLHTFAGKGKKLFKITPYLSKVKNRRITVIAMDNKGSGQKEFTLPGGFVKTPAKTKQKQSARQSGIKAGNRKPLQKSAGKAEKRPVLIERIFIANGNIQIKLVPTTTLDSKHYQTGKIVLKYGKLNREWPLKAVGALSRLKSSVKRPVVFNTNIKATSSDKAVVFFKSSGFTGVKSYAFLKPAKGFPRSKGGDTGTMQANDRFIPGGIRVTLPDREETVERGTAVRVRYQFVRGFDHLPASVEFRLDRRGSAASGELLESVRFDPAGAADLSSIGEITLMLPFGMLEGAIYRITAESSSPRQTGQSNWFRAGTPDDVISVHSPRSSDKIPPGMGLTIPVGYSFDSAVSPGNVTIRISRDLGGYNMELYSGPPRSSHLLPRPPDSWPDGDYRIVVNSDDGRIGYSQPFSLSPYRFNLISPNGGDVYSTSYSPWRFRWNGEESIERVEAVLLKGGVEMYRWTPHVSPPEYLLGDELTISPEQPWHPAGTDYKLRIEGYSTDRATSRSVLVAVDESDGFFEVIEDWEPPVVSVTECSERNPVSLLYPTRESSREGWKKGHTYSLSWCTFDETVRTVDLSLVSPSTGEIYGIRMGAPNRHESTLFTGSGSGGSMDYTVPDLIRDGYYRLRIASSDGRYDYTTFWGLYVRNWLIKGAAPARGETWAVGDTRTILWESGGLSDQTVDIFLHHWSDRRRFQVADDLPNTGSFVWTIPAEALPEGISRWDNAYLKVKIESHMADSEFFNLVR